MGDPTAQQLAEDADDRLFRGVRDNEHHVITTSSLTSPVTATVSDHVDIILYLLQKLTTEIL